MIRLRGALKPIVSSRVHACTQAPPRRGRVAFGGHTTRPARDHDLPPACVAVLCFDLFVLSFVV